MSSHRLLQRSCALLPFLFLPSALGSSGAREDESPADAAALLERVESAAGPRDARIGLRSLRMSGTVAIPGFPAAEVTESFVAPDKVRHDVELKGVGYMTMGSDGTVCWSSDPAMGVTIREGEGGSGVSRYFSICRRAPWDTLYEKAELAGREKIGDRACWKLVMTAKNGGSDDWFVDADGHLLGADLDLPDPMGGDIHMRFRFDDWVEKGGISWPRKKLQIIGDTTITYAFEEIEPDATIDAERIAPPEHVRAAIADPSKRTQEVRAEPGTYSIETVEARPVLSIRSEVAPADISKTLAVQLYECMDAVGRAKASVAGPPFSRYHNYAAAADGPLDLEAGIPVRAKAEGSGRVRASELPGGRVVVTWHVGPYHELAKTYGKLQAWMAEQKLESAGGPWEIYWTDPGIEPDPKKWRTQILWPIK